MLQTFFNILLGTFSFLIVLSIIVFIHEMGHYSVARFFKVSVERFSIGYGKPIAKWTAKSGTEWTINRIPLGGYVKFLGDAGAASNPDTEQLQKLKHDVSAQHGQESWRSCFHFKPLYQRALIILAGPFANFILAAFIYASLALALGESVLLAKISKVRPGSVAEQSGFIAGDSFVSIDGRQATKYSEVATAITLSSETQLNVIVDRNGEMVNLTVIPVRTERIDGIGGKYTGGQIGVEFSNSERTQKSYSLLEASGKGVGDVYQSLAHTGTYLKRIFQGKEDGKALGSIVKIGAITGKVGASAVNVEGSFGRKFKVWAVNLLSLGASLSIALGFANLMPIPVLDGGHLLYYVYEAVMRRPLSIKVQEFGFKIGFSVLITLFLVLTWNDIGYVANMIGNTG